MSSHDRKAVGINLRLEWSKSCRCFRAVITARTSARAMRAARKPSFITKTKRGHGRSHLRILGRGGLLDGAPPGLFVALPRDSGGEDAAHDRDAVVIAVGANKVGLSGYAADEYGPHGAGVILGVDPVADAGGPRGREPLS